MKRIAPCLWFDHQAEEAAKFYVSIFKNSRITATSRYPDAGQEVHHRKAGSVMTVSFELDGHPFLALNGGPEPGFRFSEAISMMVNCKDQAEVDYYWEKLGAGGDPRAQVCGWLKDRYGVSWQVVPEEWMAMVEDPGSPGFTRAFAAMMEMSKLDLAAIKKAYAGK